MSQFLTDFAALSSIGATAGGGVERQAGSQADAQTRRWLSAWLTERGFTVHFDRIGNQFGLFEAVPGAPYILTGSHLDSQPLAGRFDGAYGVLASAHAAARLATAWQSSEGSPKYNVGVVNWFNEEGSRFEPSMMGSSVFTGKLALDVALATSDSSGVTVDEALRATDTVGASGPIDVGGYAEIHVEQGRILAENGGTVGLVESTWAAHKYRMVVHGEQSHTGSTRMSDRKDALLGAAFVIVAARDIADRFASVPLHSSVARIDVLPNSPVVVAREVQLHLDLRSPSEETLAQAHTLLEERLREIEVEANVRIEPRLVHSWGVASYGDAGVALARSAAEELDLPYGVMMTIAGHDSTNMKDVVPTVMLFVPSVDGYAHNEKELTHDQDALAGVDLLTNVLGRMTAGELDREQ